MDNDVIELDVVDDDDFDWNKTVNFTQSAEGSSKPKCVSGVTKKIKKQTWISSSFDDFGGCGDFGAVRTSQSLPQKRPRISQTPAKHDPGKATTSSSSSSELWVDKYKPKSLNDLAVHKKKVSEVQDWLRTKFSTHSQQGAPILLLTGPAGCGKSATVFALAHYMNIDMKEWSNTVVENIQTMNPDARARPDFVSVGGSRYESQSSQFADFLLRANRYPSLQMFNQHSCQHKLIFVEEYPNVFFFQTHQFHDILRKYKKQGQSPIVFVVSDSSGGDSNERLLFPKDVQAELNIANISFNPVAPTSLSKVLQKIASSEVSLAGGRMQVPDKWELDSLVSSCAGDIRGAINALQFTCRKGFQPKSSWSTKSSLGKTKAGKSSKNVLKAKSDGSSLSRRKKTGATAADGADAQMAAVGARDSSLFLFRALGKILYCKRESKEREEMTFRLPDHLSHHHRLPLQFDPEEVVERSHVSGEFFVSYLHQNYVDFFPLLEDVIRASEYLSDADHLTTNWTIRQTLCTYAASVATRGLIHSNSTRSGLGGVPPASTGWKPLHKPQWFSVNRQMRENVAAAKALFRDWHSTPEELQTQLLPYMAKTRPKLNRPGQRNLLQEMTRFSSWRNPRSVEKLDEKDIGEEIEDDNVPTSAIPKDEDNGADVLMNSKETEDEEIIIEDFDD